MADTSLLAETASPSTAPTQPAPPADTRRDRILACFQLGWKLEELAGVCQLRDPQDLVTQPGFPADLPVAQLQRVQLLVQDLNALLELLDVATPAQANRSQAAGTAADLVSAMQTWASTGGADPAPITAAVKALDNTIVPHLVGDEPDSAFEAAYELGKALSLTYWSLEVTGRKADTQAVITAWSTLFAIGRVDTIQRRLSLVGSIFSAQDPADHKAGQIAQAMSTVSSSLEYWQHSLQHLDNITPAVKVKQLKAPASRAQSAPSVPAGLADPTIQATLARQPDVLPLLLSALNDQQAIWYDVLTGQRAVNSLCPTGILLSLTEDLAGNAWSRVRHLLPLFVGLFATILVFGATVGLGILVLHRQPLGQQASALTTILTVLGGAATYVAAIGAGLIHRGQNAVRQVELRTQQVVATAQQTTEAATQVVGPVGTRAATLAHEALDNVIQQIEQEEYTIMTCQPLVLFVLRRAQQETGDPLQDATAFLRLVYQGRSNLERLLAIFPELYMAMAVTG